MTTYSVTVGITATSPTDAVQVLDMVDGDTLELHVFDEPVDGPFANLYAYIPAGTVIGETRIVRLMDFPCYDNSYGMRLVSDCWFDCGPAYTGARLVFNKVGGTAFLTWSGVTWLVQCTLVNGDGEQIMLVDTNETNRHA